MMKKMLLIVSIPAIFLACANGSGSAADSDTNVSSTTPPPNADTNPVGIMMGDTTIGMNDSLKNDRLKK